MAAISKDSSQVEVSESVDDKVQDLTEEAGDSAELDTPDWLHEAMAESEDDDSHFDAAAGVAAAVGVAALFSEDEPDQETGEQDSSEISESDELLEAEIDQVSGSQFQELDDELETPFEDTIFDSSSITAASVADAAAIAGSALVGNEKQEESGFELEDIVSESQIEDPMVTGDDLLAEEDLSESDSDIPDWLQDLGEDIGEQPESVVEPAVIDELSQEEEEVIPPIPVLETGDEPDPVQEAQVELDEPVSEISSDNKIESEETEVEFTDAIPDWLSEVSPEGVPDLANQVTETDREFPEIARAEIPDWLRKMEQEHKAELAAIENPEITQGLEFDSEVTDLAGEDVPSWLMSAMDTESSGEPVEISEIEDISEILSEDILESDFEIEEEIYSEPEMEGDLTQDLEPGKTLAVAAIAAEILSEDESDDYDEAEIEIAETIEGEQIIEELEVEAFISEPIETGEEFSEPAAEAILDDEKLVEGDTQPISVGMQDDKLVDTLTTELDEVPLSSTEGELAEELEPIEVSEEEKAEIEIQGDEEQPIFDEVAGAESILAEDVPLTEEDQDAAMAWLESLAAKQGAAEEELLTAPDERLDEPPDWIQEMVDEDELIAEAEQVEKIDPAAAAALAGLAAGAILSDKDQAEITEDEVSEPIETPSEWIPEVAEVVTDQPDLEIDESHAVAAEEIEPDFAAEPPVVDHPAEPDEEKETPLEEQVAEDVTSEETPEEIPDWLADLGGAEEIEVEPIPEEWTPAMFVEEEGDPVPVEKPFEAKIDLNAASLSQLERIPGIGFIHAQRILNYRTESGSFKSIDELEKVHGLTPDMVKDLRNYLTIEVVVEAAPPVSSHPDLQGAWTNVNEGEIETAVSQYTELINRDEHLDEVIRDLQEALVKYPQDASLYQALGDAYMHANMLDEALDAYNRAEDFIN
jgi:competence ComEA-like helix-hairpin-helix protein